MTLRVYLSFCIYETGISIQERNKFGFAGLTQSKTHLGVNNEAKAYLATKKQVRGTKSRMFIWEDGRGNLPSPLPLSVPKSGLPSPLPGKE